MIRLFNAYFPARTLVLGVSEALLVTLAFLFATVARYGARTEFVLFQDHGFAKIGLVVGVFMICIYYFDLYDTLVLGNLRELFPHLAQTLGTATLLLAVIYYVFPSTRLGRSVFLIGVLLLPLLLSSCRRIFLWVALSKRLAERVLIVGKDSLAGALAKEVMRRPELGMNLVGYVDADQDSAMMNGVPYLGTPEVLSGLRERNGVRRIIVAMRERRGRLPLEKLLTLKTRGIQVQDALEIYETVAGKVPLESLRPSWFVFSSGFQFSQLQKVYKRTLSLCGSLIGLVMALPGMVLVAVIVKLDSPGPIIFRQQRVGKDGKIFNLYKFRSMHVSADADGKPQPAVKNDKRFTRVGRWLRRTRLDELPQLYNILRGEMDFVGPRPFPPSLEQEFARQIPFYSHRSSVKPGATGWAQVNRGYCNTVEDNAEKLSYDLYYIKNMSIGLDLLILVQTARILLWGRGAH